MRLPHVLVWTIFGFASFDLYERIFNKTDLKIALSGIIVGLCVAMVVLWVVKK